MSWHNVLDRRTSDASDYNGYAEEGSFEVWGPPEQMAPVNIVSEIFAWIVDHLPQYNGKALQIIINADWSPTAYTKYEIIIVAYPSNAQSAITSNEVAKPQIVISMSVLVGLLLSTLLVGWVMQGVVKSRIGTWGTGTPDDPGSFGGDFDIEEFISDYGIYIGAGVLAFILLPRLMPRRQ